MRYAGVGYRACLIASQSSSADCYYRQKDCSPQQSIEGDLVKKYGTGDFKDPLGNAVIGGGGTGIVKGSESAGGAKMVRDVAIRVSQNTAKDYMAPPKA